MEIWRTEDDFVPFTVKIRIQSEEEYTTLLMLAHNRDEVSQGLNNNNQIVDDFLQQLGHALCSR